eukprot:sb/3467303/
MTKESNVTKQLYLFLRKITLNKLVNADAIVAEIDVLSKVEQRNRPQQRTRKYLRLTRQLCCSTPKAVQRLRDYAATTNSLCQTLSTGEFCLDRLQKFYLETVELNRTLHDTRQFILNLIRELHFYISNTEFVRILMVVMALTSKIYSLLAQPETFTGKILSVLKDCVVPKKVVNHSDESDMGQSPVLSEEFQPVEDSRKFPVPEEDLGEPVVLEEDSEDNDLKDTDIFDQSMLGEAVHVKNSDCNVTPHVRQSRYQVIRLKRPTYKVYKQRHPWLRKLEKYSTDYLRTRPPDYSYSLYLSC